MTWSATVAASVAVGIGLVVARSEYERRAALAKRAKDERRFGLLADESAAEGLRRITLAQLDLAIELLRGDSDIAPEEAVHETRKALKRLRALMRLLEGELGAGRAKRERAVLRDAAKRLAGARDAEVMASTLEGLIARHPRKLGRRRGVIELCEHLDYERRAAAVRALGDVATRELVAEELCAVRARVMGWRLADRPAGRLAGPGLEHIYRSGREGHRRARRPKAGPKARHKWRKHVKDLRYAAEVLDVREPQKTDSKRSGKRFTEHARKRQSKRAGKRVTARVARRADKLGEALGAEHDLVLLEGLVRTHKPLKRRRGARRRLLRVISHRRGRLRKRALREGARLYERKPRRFVRNMRA